MDSRNFDGTDEHQDANIVYSTDNLAAYLKDTVAVEDIGVLKLRITCLKELLSSPDSSSLLDSCQREDDCARIRTVLSELDQVLAAYSIERARYYIKRLIKGLTTKKKGRINDLDLNRWKEYDDILTDSLWVLNKRDRTGAHNAGYWGNFIPQIPQQLMQRFTKKGDWVLDTFVGSGTTLIECKRLGRNGIGIDLSLDALNTSRQNIGRQQNADEVRTELVNSDSTDLDYSSLLDRLRIDSVQLVIMHPPYWDIIKFSENERDMSNAASAEVFLSKIRQVAKNVRQVLEKDRYLALVIGDKYSGGEWIPLGFMAMSEIKSEGYRLKSIIVKNFDLTRGKQSQKQLWRYRALLGGFYVFKHEYIFLFQK